MEYLVYMIEIIFYLIGITIICIGGYNIKSLTLSGSIAAFIVACCVALGFGWRGLVLLGTFFVSSSLWSKYKKQKKEKLAEILEKGERRDWIQVMANGAVTSFAALLFYVTGNDMWQMAFIISLAAANADTWASEIGVLSKRRPIYILSLKAVDKGTSGAVSLLGLLSSLGGSLLIVAVSSILLPVSSVASLFFMIVCGFVGSLIDTILGALVQVKYKCEQCGIITEKSVHCGQNTVIIEGIGYINNDAVNLLSIFSATLLGVLTFPLFQL